MGADLTASVSFLQGLILQDPRLTAAYIDDSSSSASTQAGPLPGHAIAQQDTDLVLDTTGSQSAGKSLRVRMQRSGHPGCDEGATIWQYESETLWTGWDAPLSISDFEFIDVSNTNDAWEFPDAVVTASGRIVVVVQKSNRYVTCWWRDPDTKTWNEKEIYDEGSTFSAGEQARPCVMMLPSGRLVCYFWRTPGGAGGSTIRMHYSDDEGATWTVGQFDCLPSSFNTTLYDLGRIRAVYLNGQVMLLLSTSSATTPVHQIHQYASDDLGVSFSLIDILDTGNSRVAPVLLTNLAEDRIIVAYVGYGGSGQVGPYVRILGSASEPLGSADATSVVVGSAEWGQHSGGTFSSFELAGYRDEDGSLYLFGNDHDAAGGAEREMTVLRSADDGQTWTAPGDSSATNHDSASVWYGNDAATYLSDYCAVAWRGMGVIIHMGIVDPEAAGYDYGASLMATFLGGHTRVCQPQYSDLSETEIGGRASWERTWLPFCRPDDLPFWTATIAGTPGIIPVANGMSIVQGGAEAAEWTGTPTTTLSQGLIFLCEGRTSAANPLLTQFIEMKISDGSTESYEIALEITGTLFTLLDDGTGGSPALLATAAAAASDGYQVLIAIDNNASGSPSGQCSVWYRLKDTDTAWQQWIELGTGPHSLSDSGGTGVANTITAGTVVGQVGTSFFKILCHSQGTYTGAQLAGGQNNPRRLLGRTVMPTPVYVNDGVSIFASDGPGVRPDEWHIDTRYTYSYRNTDPRRTPSPRLGHRTLDDSSDADIVWVLGESTSDEHAQLGSFFALYLGELNWRTGEVWARSGGSWSKIIDIDTSLPSNPTTLGFTRKGANILADLSSGGNLEMFLHEHTLAGSTWDYGDGTTTPRKITTNSSGAWTRSTVGTTRPPRLLLESYATGDPTSGATGRIWSKEAVVMLPRTLLSSYDAIRLRVKAQDTADGDLRTGIALAGWFLPFGEVYSGRGLDVAPNYELTTSRNGARTARSLGRNRRAVEFDWTDGVWEEGLADDPPIPDYFRYLQTSGEVIAHPNATAQDVMGAYERAKGAMEPVVYLPRVSTQPGPGLSTVTITNRSLMLYGRLVSETFRHDVAEGDEWSTTRPEYKRVNTTRIEEEV